jgi:hypothetical protein
MKKLIFVVSLMATVSFLSGCVSPPPPPQITCYQCLDNEEQQQNFLGTTCPTGWFDEHQICSSEDKIQKMSIIYSGRIDDPGAKQFLALHFDLVDTAFGYNTIIEWIKTNAINPNIKIIGYDDTLNAVDVGTYPEDYYLHATDESRLRFTGTWPGYAMNPNLGWKPYLIQHVQSELNTNTAYDGVFMDNFAYNLQSQAYGPYSFDHPFSEFGDGYSISNWGNWMVSFATDEKTALGNDLVMVNCHIDYLPGVASGAMLFENCFHADSAGYDTNGMTFANGWNGGLMAVDALHEAASQGAIIATHSGCSGGTLEQKEHWAKYCYAMLSFATIDLGKTYFTWMFYGQDTTNGWWQFTDDIILGPPVNPDTTYTRIGTTHVYYREFSNYYVVANLDNLGTSSTFNFQGSHTLEGKHALFIEKG